MILKPEDLRDLKLSGPEHVADIVQKYNSLDMPRDNTLMFTNYLLQRSDAWFVEAGEVGLFYFTNITPHLDAVFNMVFWDKRLTGDRRESAKLAIHAAFKLFELRRISAVVVESNIPLRKTLQKIGFTAEGIIRQSVVVDGQYADVYRFGLLIEEMTWPSLKTSLV